MIVEQAVNESDGLGRNVYCLIDLFSGNIRQRTAILRGIKREQRSISNIE